jgi:pimeloyl-ACP methyl ester carboxylesterase
VSRPSRNQAILAAGLAGATAGAAWLTARRTAAESRQRRSRSDAGRPLEVAGADGGYRHVRVHGPDDAPTLVLVHCWTGTQELWHKQVAELAGELRIVAYDHRGHGLSEDARDGDYSLEALAADLDLVIHAATRGDELPVLAGHSLGAMTIAAWADAEHGRLARSARGAALLSTGLEELTAQTAAVPSLPGPFQTFQGRIADLVLGAPFSIKGTPVTLGKMAVHALALGPDARDEDVDLTTRMALDCRTRARAGCGVAMSRMSLLHAIDELTVPTIVIAGGSDLMTPTDHAERIETALPRSLGLRVAPRAGHMTPLEAPQLVNDALREVFAATAEGTPESRLAA